MKFNILQWNVLWKESLDNIAKEIEHLGPDIICAQEFYQFKIKKTDTAKQLAGIIDYDYFYKEADTWSTKDDKESQGNAIFSKHPLIKTHYSYVQQPKHNPPNATEEGRVYIEVDVKFDDRVLTFGTVHLSYSHKFKITPLRLQEAGELIKILGQKKKNFVFTGDLNAFPQTQIIKDIDKLLVHAGPDYDQPTFANQPFDYHGYQVNDLQFRIDYVFTTQDIKVVDSQIIHTPYSDHLPILTTIELE